MTVRVERPTLESRRENLRWLARSWDQRAPAVRALMLWALIHGSMDDQAGPPCTCGICLACTWDAYRWDLELLDGIENRPWASERDWRDINPDLTCPDKDGAARDEIYGRVADGEDVLLRGVTARGRKVIIPARQEPGRAA